MILTVCANPSVDSFWSVEEITAGTTNRSQQESFHPGGKGIHTALALSELGKDVSTLGLWGGQMGQWLKKECEKHGIVTIGPFVDNWNRLCLTLKSETAWDETELLGHGPDASKAKATEFEDLYTHFCTANHPEAVLISGSTPGGFDTKLYNRMIKKAEEKETPAFVDASGVLLEKSLDARPQGIHINQKEGKKLTGKKDPVKIVGWLADYCNIAAVTAGADGLYLQYKNTVYHASHALSEDEIYSTIGAGDCLLAGLCLATLYNNYPSYWSKYAVACASANCICPRLGMLEAKDVNKIVGQVKLEKC